jgi:hypothetical protein
MRREAEVAIRISFGPPAEDPDLAWLRRHSAARRQIALDREAWLRERMAHLRALQRALEAHSAPAPVRDLETVRTFPSARVWSG